ncbi:predicted protein [Arabidopsis lyrata subsp. lyrata]|uniref:Predicted protein n=1 Tax=Arabidopsis lyrata subsp. lyrata TaxID=81972 RepID=D7LI89_ARALL|nr:predicted protein [Arabidopsis lyrata subsp. lyrata]
MHVQPGTTRTSFDESPALRKVDETPPKHVQFLEPISKTVVEDAQNPSYGYVFDDLQISGEPYPGHELQACDFQWVCHLEDGSVNYIDGAKQPNYLVTADDVHLYLAIEVQPLDDRNRKGELVKVFANNNRNSQDRLPNPLFIFAVPEMQSNIEKTLHTGHASYKVSHATGFLDIWEAATLSIKREGYSIKCNNNLTIAEKFSASTAITIPFGQPAELVIIGSDGSEHSFTSR